MFSNSFFIQRIEIIVLVNFVIKCNSTSLAIFMLDDNYFYGGSNQHATNRKLHHELQDADIYTDYEQTSAADDQLSTALSAINYWEQPSVDDMDIMENRFKPLGPQEQSIGQYDALGASLFVTGLLAVYGLIILLFISSLIRR